MLFRSPEVLAEAIQTILRVEGVEDPYELLRGLMRGEGLTLDRLRTFVDGLSVDSDVKDRLRDLRPTDYVGLAPQICDRAVGAARRWLER